MNMTETETLVAQWGKDRGIINDSMAHLIPQLAKLREENAELTEAILRLNQDDIIDGIGDIAVVLTMIAHITGTTLEDCYAAAYEQIKDRKGKMVNGQFVKEVG